MAAAIECGIPHNPDYNGATQDGISYMQYCIEDGLRHSIVAAYLRPIAEHPSLRVLLRARARRLLFDGRRCVGVEFTREGKTERIHAGEVVVSGGTIGSPQLLMLSGVGPAEHLRSHGIDVVADLPGVGENLHDHLLSPVIFSAEREVGPPSPGLPACQTHLFWRSRPGLVVPDIQPIHFMVPMDIEPKPPTLEVRINGALVEQSVITKEENWRAWIVQSLPDRKNEVRITMSAAPVPAELKKGEDPRALGLELRDFSWVPAQ